MTADADNSAKNVRDRNDATLTPGDQGNAPADRDITQRVRKTLMNGPNDYSTTGQEHQNRDRQRQGHAPRSGQ
jgi:hypothetical protein